MSDPNQEKALRPIYAFLDSYSYTKALKLTYTKPQCVWPITIALRAHCLERTGKTLDACRELRLLLCALSQSGSDEQGKGSGGGESNEKKDWCELDELIWILGLGSEGQRSTVGVNGAGESSSSAPSGGGGSASGKGKKGKGKSSAKNTNASTTNSKTSDVQKAPLDMIHVLDLPQFKRQEIIASSGYIESTFTSNKYAYKAEDVLDGTVIATIVFTLSSLGLDQTIANLYSRCISLRTSKTTKDTQLDQNKKEELCTFLIEGYQSQLKWIATQRNVTLAKISSCSYMKNLDLHSARTVLRAWEEAQFIAMSLIKFASCSLYQSWCSFATIQHWKSCKILLDLLRSSCDDNDVHEEIQKLEQKVKMLPRLAEMLVQRVCSTNNENNENQFPPSADDWRLYIDCLTSQDKYEDAISILSSVKCGVEKQGRQINDEIDVKNHLGSLIQLSEREKMEMIADLNIKVGKYDVATKLYAETLLEMLPDQWSYWESMFHSSLKCHKNNYDLAVQECNQVLDRVMKKQESLRSEAKISSRVPIRGPHLFRVYIIAEGIRQCNLGDGDIQDQLCNAIIQYGNMFGSLVSCCFQDLRPYVELLITFNKVNKFELGGVISKMIDWLKEIRRKNSLGVEQNSVSDDSLDDKKERRSKLRGYIFSIKLCFELWYQCLQHYIDDEKKEIDKLFSSAVPSVDDMILLWGNTLDLGSNPNDGGQKETLPGDDLILLANQLLLYHNFLQEKTQRNLFILSATILEAAMVESPYNPYFKIAAINVYTKMGGIKRAFEIFNDMNISHVQMDSCSYIILPHLCNHILPNETVQVAGRILNLHTSSARDVSKYMPKSFDNGNLQKGLEMISWQRFQMNHSLQLLHAKRMIVDLAPLIVENTGTEKAESSSCIGTLHGICGNKATDATRAEKIVRNATNHQSATSLIHFANFKDLHVEENMNFLSDNRDFTINQFEILERTKHHDSLQQSLLSAHMNSIITRVVLFIDVCKPPKKGKVAKYAIGDALDLRAKSLLYSLTRTEAFLATLKQDRNVNISLWNMILCLCQSICTLGAGQSSIKEEDILPDASLAQRESRCSKLLNNANRNINEAMKYLEQLQNDLSDETKPELFCNLLTEVLIPVYIILRTTSNLFGIFAWNKRKRYTKEAVGALADVALNFKKLLINIEDICHESWSKDSGISLTDSLLTLLSKSSSLINVEECKIDIVADNCEDQRAKRESTIKAIFREMIEELETFNVDE